MTTAINCKAKVPSACPYHGTRVWLEESAKSGNVEKYLAEKRLIEKQRKQEWVAANLVTYSPKTVQDPESLLSPKEFKLLWKRLRGSYLLSELKTMKVDADTTVFVSYNRNGEASFNYETLETQHIFSLGACAYFAYALHEKTHYPVTIFSADKNAEYWSGHVALKIGEDKYLDVTGVSSEADYVRKYSLKKETYGVETTEDMQRFKTVMGVTDSVYDSLEDLEKAILDRCTDDVIKDYLF